MASSTEDALEPLEITVELINDLMLDLFSEPLAEFAVRVFAFGGDDGGLGILRAFPDHDVGVTVSIPITDVIGHHLFDQGDREDLADFLLAAVEHLAVRAYHPDTP